MQSSNNKLKIIKNMNKLSEIYNEKYLFNRWSNEEVENIVGIIKSLIEICSHCIFFCCRY